MKSAFVRAENEILDFRFLEAYAQGNLTFQSYSVPDEFKSLYEKLKQHYGLTNALNPNSCLIIPQSKDLNQLLLETQIPPLYLDSRLREDSASLFTSCGIILPHPAEEETTYTQAVERIANDQRSCIFYVNALSWDNEQLQRGLINAGKAYSVLLPELDLPDPAPEYGER